MFVSVRRITRKVVDGFQYEAFEIDRLRNKQLIKFWNEPDPEYGLKRIVGSPNHDVQIAFSYSINGQGLLSGTTNKWLNIGNCGWSGIPVVSRIRNQMTRITGVGGCCGGYAGLCLTCAALPKVPNHDPVYAKPEIPGSSSQASSGAMSVEVEDNSAKQPARRQYETLTA